MIYYGQKIKNSKLGSDKLKEYFQHRIYIMEEFYNKNKMDRQKKCVLGGMEDYCCLDYGNPI